MKQLFILIAIAAMHGSAGAQSVLSPVKRAKIDSMIATWQAHGFFSGTLVIARKGEIVYRRSAGLADIASGIPNSDTSRFNLASISKPFTAIAVLQLAGKRKLRLTDAFARYFPGFPYADVTVEQLLAHTSGLPEADRFERPYIHAHPNEVLAGKTVYDHLVQLKPPPLARPGEKHFYNNLNYILLALLVEKIGRMPFAQYMKRHVFEKAGMEKTYVRGSTGPNTSRYFRPVFFDTAFVHADSVFNRKIYTDYPLGGTFGDNNVVTAAQDMVRFDRALDDGRLLPAALRETMFSPVKLANGEFFYLGGRKTYTLGWNQNVKNSAGQFVVWHDGSLVGLTTLFFKNLTDSITYIFYENRQQHGFFRRFLAISAVVDDLPPVEFPLRRSLAREYGRVLVTEGADAAVVRLHALREDTVYYLEEIEMNELGYDLMRKSGNAAYEKLALEVFRLNTVLFPKSANVFDSYAEGLRHFAMKREAAAMYRRALAMDPKNEKARRALEELQRELRVR